MSTLWPRPRDSVSPQQTRYYCYACDVEVPIYMAPDPTCQNCNDQFVQEVDADSDPRAFLAGTAEESSTGAREDNNDNSFGLLTLADSERLANELLSINALLHRVMDSVATPPAISDGSSLPQRLHQSPEPSIHHEAFRSHRRMAESNIQFRRMNSDDFSYVRRARRADRGAHREEEGDTAAATGSRDPYLRRFSNIFRMIENLPILGDGIVGDPDDYVFTEDALDNIITRLLDQGSGTGPPPAPDSVIDALPRRALTNQEIHQRIDCAICKDEFARSELEVELPCAHLFHPDCIKPWLKMNGTCPVCRQTVTAADEENEGRSASGPSPEAQRISSTFTRFVGRQRVIPELRQHDRMPGFFRTGNGDRASSGRVTPPPPPNNPWYSNHSSPDDPMDID